MAVWNHAIQIAHQAGNGPFMNRSQPTQDAGFARKLRPKAQRAIKIGKGDDAGAPVPDGPKRHLYFRDDRICAIGVMHQFNVVAADFKEARRLLGAHDLHRAYIAAVTQHAPHR